MSETNLAGGWANVVASANCFDGLKSGRLDLPLNRVSFIKLHSNTPRGR